MKKITIITMQLKTPGGIERFVSTLATMFSDEFEVEIVANYGKKTEPLAFPLPQNVKVSFLTPSQPKEVSMKSLVRNLKWHQIPSELRRRANIAKTQDHAFKNYLKVIDTNFIITDRAHYNFLVGKYYHGNAKKIATDHNYHQNNLKYIRTLVKSIKNFDNLVVATKELRDFYQPLTTVKCHFINNPLDHIPTQKSTLDSKNILSIGRFVPEKDFAALVNTMAIVHKKDPSVHLTIIGDGITMPQIKKQIASLKLDNAISLPGFLNQTEIEKYYYNSSLFVMTSKTEAFGLVLAEAMSYGLPCVAFSRASGARAQITKNTGFLINGDNTQELATKILYLINNNEILKSFQPKIQTYIQKTASKTAILPQWLDIFSDPSR